MPHSIRSINYPVITTHYSKQEVKLFEIAFHNAAIGMAMVKPDGQWIKVNQAMCSLLGYTEEELLNKKYSELTYKDDLPKNLEAVKKLKKGEVNSFRLEKRYIHKSGKLIWINITVSSVRNDDASLAFMITQVEDISKRKEYEVQIDNQIKTLEKFKKAIESSSDQIVITDVDGYILFINEATEKITGYSREEIMHSKAGVLWGGQMDNAFYEKMWDTIKNKKKPFQGIVKNKRKNGEEYYALIKIAPVLDSNKKVVSFIGTERDVTETVQIDQMKTEFISLASHQLKTPLSAIKWFSEMLLDKSMGSLNENQIKCVSNIVSSNERMLSIVGDLLNISKIEAGKLSLKAEKVNVLDIVDEVIKELEVEINNKEIHVLCGGCNHMPIIFCDRNALKNIFSNLISNAVKYTPENGEISIEGYERTKEFEFRVKDSGMGIDEEERDKIFKKFYRAKEAIDTNPEGTGLGLYIIQLLVEAMGGKITFESKMGKGTTFIFTIPKKDRNTKGEFMVDS